MPSRRSWSAMAPNYEQRKTMLSKCGKSACFLGPNRSFPICNKNTCRRNRRGVRAAHMRAKQMVTKYKGTKNARKYRRIAGKAKRILRRTRKRSR